MFSRMQWQVSSTIGAWNQRRESEGTRIEYANYSSHSVMLLFLTGADRREAI